LTIRIRLFGEQDESVAYVLQYMGTLEFRANKLDSAFQLLDEFVRIRQDNGTEPDGDYVNVLFMIGNMHKMQGNETEAQKCWTEAYDVFQELGLADGNPQIAEVMGNLVKDDTRKNRHRNKRSGKTVTAAAETQNNSADQDAMMQRPNKSVPRRVFGRLAGKVKGGRGKKGLGHQL
jgi:tetratricopeptide (TPR) repeat protein